MKLETFFTTLKHYGVPQEQIDAADWDNGFIACSTTVKECLMHSTLWERSEAGVDFWLGIYNNIPPGLSSVTDLDSEPAQPVEDIDWANMAIEAETPEQRHLAAKWLANKLNTEVHTLYTHPRNVYVRMSIEYGGIANFRDRSCHMDMTYCAWYTNHYAPSQAAPVPAPPPAPIEAPARTGFYWDDITEHVRLHGVTPTQVVETHVFSKSEDGKLVCSPTAAYVGWLSIIGESLEGRLMSEPPLTEAEISLLKVACND